MSMNLLLKIIITFIAVICTHTSQANLSYRVKEYRTKNFTEYLNFEENYAVLPEGPFKGLGVEKRWLENLLAAQFRSISKIYDLSFSSEIYLDDFNVLEALANLGVMERFLNAFTTSFSLETFDGVTHQDIQCKTRTFLYFSIEPKLWLENCKNEQINLLMDVVQINLSNRLATYTYIDESTLD